MTDPTPDSSAAVAAAEAVVETAAAVLAPGSVKVSAAIALLTALIAAAQKVSAMISEADAAGSQTLTAVQWAKIVADDDSAAADLKAAIDAAPAGLPVNSG